MRCAVLTPPIDGIGTRSTSLCRRTRSKPQSQTPERQGSSPLPEVRQAVKDSGVQSGLCLVFCPHTTAGLALNSYLDPATAKDIRHELDRLVPTRVDFAHIVMAPSDAARTSRRHSSAPGPADRERGGCRARLGTGVLCVNLMVPASAKFTCRSWRTPDNGATAAP
jgi:hypothetical protein